MSLSAIIAFAVFAGGALLIVQAVFFDKSAGGSSSQKKFRTLKKKESTLSETFNSLGGFNSLFLDRSPQARDRMNSRLMRADLKLNAYGLMFLKEMAAAVAVILVLIIGVEGPIAIGLPFIGFLLPDFVVRSKANSREYRILRTFPEIIDLMGLCLSAGLDFLASLRWLTEGAFMFDNPFIDELKRLKEEIMLGKSKIEALKNLDKRLEISEVSSLVRTLVIAEQMGVSVIDTFERFSADVRDRRFQRGERQARMSAIKILFPLIFLILPVVGIVIIGPIALQFMQQDFMKGMGM